MAALGVLMIGAAGTVLAQSPAAPRQRGGAFVMPGQEGAASGATAQPQDEIDAKPALDAALAWLQLTDGGMADKSWREASPLFQHTMRPTEWLQTLRAARAPLGRVVSRKIASATFTRSLPGAPDGEYVVIQYDTVFQNKAQATETVTPARGLDGRWRVAGYLIK
ncbi:hypothetical protein PTE30175_05482 [Pandoraea terrae]|uniref:DUF4019 domain-containing protein n=2 Tax=Pandoraea terrae TaxID=1537710 RepID=A0A5E4ZDP7_9BURK|nr:hypothetical protein PTE30175_05482 [Pandoraea terrae]